MSTIVKPDVPDEKSPGHICSEEGFEIYERGGEVYRASRSNVFDCLSGYRIGRWECSLEHYEKLHGPTMKDPGLKRWRRVWRMGSRDNEHSTESAAQEPVHLH